MAVISVIMMFIVIKLIFIGEKMQALVAILAMIRSIKAISKEIEAIHKEYWIIIIWLSLILLCILFLTIEKLYRMPILRKYHYSNTIKIMLFISDIKSYVPIKLCKASGSIHLFKLTGSINRENVTLHKNTLWDILEIDWRLLEDSGSAENKEIFLFSHDKLLLASILRPLHQVTKEMLV